MSDPDPARCPLCGSPNDCGLSRGESTCWCFSTPVPAGVVARVPPESGDKACVCARCAREGALPSHEPQSR